jgi:uncharacterized protein
MGKITLRFYEELNGYLPPGKRKRDFEDSFEGRCTLRQVLEEHGVPGSEVDLILVNGQPVDFGYTVQDGDRVSIYPVFERLNIGGVTKLRGRPLRKIRFMAERELADTAERLERLGFEVLCLSGPATAEAMEVSRREKRILLTSRAKLAESGRLSHVVRVPPGRVEDQIRAIFEALDLDEKCVGRGQAWRKPRWKKEAGP